MTRVARARRCSLHSCTDQSSLRRIARGSGIWTGHSYAPLQSLGKSGETSPRSDCPHGFGHCPPTAYEDNEALGTGDGGVEQIALQHQPGVCRERDDDTGVLAALAAMNA